MNTNDLIFAVGSGVFAVALVPAVVKRVHMPRSSTVPIAVVLTAFCATYARMGFWYSLVTTAVTAGCWWALVLLGGGSPTTVHVHTKVASAVVRESA
jgi:hypothetical protein